MYTVTLQGSKERGKAWNTQVVFVNSGDGSRGFHPPKKDPGAVWLAFVDAHNGKAASMGRKGQTVTLFASVVEWFMTFVLKTKGRKARAFESHRWRLYRRIVKRYHNGL